MLQADEYSAQNLYYSSAKTEIQAMRGEILDTNGTPLVYNESSNTVYIDASYFPKASKIEERNEIILSLITLFDQKGMMIDCATARSELTYFENSVEVNLPLDSIDVENIAKVDLYVLNNIEDMLTVMAPTTLN